MVEGILEADLVWGWSFSLDELELLKAKSVRTHLGFMAQLKVFAATGRFPRVASNVTMTFHAPEARSPGFGA